MSNNSTAARSGNFPTFYTRRDAEGVKVALWAGRSAEAGVVEFNGTLGERKVTLRSVNGSRGRFLTVVEMRVAAAGEGEPAVRKEVTIGAANIVVSDKGYPNLAVRLNGQDQVIWASVSRTAPQQLLVDAGLDLDRLERKRAAAQQARAEAGRAPEDEYAL